MISATPEQKENNLPETVVRLDSNMSDKSRPVMGFWWVFVCFRLVDLAHR